MSHPPPIETSTEMPASPSTSLPLGGRFSTTPFARVRSRAERFSAICSVRR
jgi:hypothetical protein